MACGPHPGNPTPQDIVTQGTTFYVGTPDDGMRVLETYETLGIEEIFRLCAIGPASHQEVFNTIRLCGECVIPHFMEKQRHTAPAAQLITRNVDVN